MSKNVTLLSFSVHLRISSNRWHAFPTFTFSTSFRVQSTNLGLNLDISNSISLASVSRKYSINPSGVSGATRDLNQTNKNTSTKKSQTQKNMTIYFNILRYPINENSKPTSQITCLTARRRSFSSRTWRSKASRASESFSSRLWNSLRAIWPVCGCPSKPSGSFLGLPTSLNSKKFKT